MQSRFGALLAVGLLVLLALSGFGLMLGGQLLTAVRANRQLTAMSTRHDLEDARLRALRSAIGDLTRDVEKGHVVADAEWRPLEQAMRAGLSAAPAVDPRMPDAIRSALAADAQAERRFADAALALMAGARNGATGVKAGMPTFITQLHDLEKSRQTSHEVLNRQLARCSIRIEELARRALAQVALAGLLILSFVTLVIVWVRKRIMRPLFDTVAAIRAMNAGRTPAPLDMAASRDEMGELARGLEALSRASAERERIQRQVEYLAHHDPLTGLVNRVVFSERLSALLAAGPPIALLAIDLDGFKGVNDSLGHATGDKMLIRTAALLMAAAGEGDVAARIGGDEFAIIHRLLPGETDASALVERIYAIAGADDTVPAIRLSVGVALSSRHGQDGDELHACADIALYRAKADGRNCARHYDMVMDEQRRRRRSLSHELRGAVQRGEMHLAFQPIADCATRRIIGQEALARWTHPVLGAISPDMFIPLAEEDGLITEIGWHLLSEALHVARSWRHDWRLAINLSPVQLRDPGMAERMLAMIASYGYDPHRLEVEVTEGVLINERKTATTNLRTLRSAGVRIVMDDFGTGYSSLSSLQQFPFDKIKIDRSFVAGMNTHGPALSIVRASIGLGRSLNIPIVAEGVETEQQLAALQALGCEQVQGFLIGRPTSCQAKAA
ncbi:EAL domain-containing protein [Sphingomonas sp.]|uniref:putative bifunctional diguanylate cyclase/phosphodiesterase n=1 Tax=Sphingomonas sp. TaxID=28214 RepID=UPI0028A0AA57|nr:EAL domain-containing protein [Sphingomonas sp.]